MRVDETLKACRLDGFDVPAWIEQRLIDYLILGSGVIDVEVEEFQNLAEPRGVLVHPCLYGWPSKYSPVPSLTLRLAVDNLQKDGAVAITLNGQRVKEADQSGPGVLTAPVDPHQLRLAPNEVTLRVQVQAAWDRNRRKLIIYLLNRGPEDEAVALNPTPLRRTFNTLIARRLWAEDATTVETAKDHGYIRRRDSTSEASLRDAVTFTSPKFSFTEIVLE